MAELENENSQFEDQTEENTIVDGETYNDDDESSNESIDSPENSEEESNSEDSSETDNENSPEEELSHAEQVRLGKALSAERRKMRQDYELKLAQERENLHAANARNQEAPENSIWDPEIGEYVDINTPEGKIVLRNYKIAQNRQTMTATAEANELRAAVDEGYTRFDHDKYDNAKKTFIKTGTDPMAEALKGADDPAAVVNYLGAKPSEIKRIAQLPPSKQMREIHRVDELLTPRKKMVTKASAPMKSINSNKNYAVDPADQGYQAREDYWRKQNNPR